LGLLKRLLYSAIWDGGRMTGLPALHIWVDPTKGTCGIRQVIRDDAELKRVKDMEKVLAKQGEVGLYRIVVVNDPENPVRVIPPGDGE